MLVCTWFNTAAAQTFSIDLNEVSRIYAELFPQRNATAVWDTTAAFDWTHIHLGNQRYKAPNFLETDNDSTQQVVEYGVYVPYRFTFTVPRTQPFALRPENKGDLLAYQPRNFTIPGLRIQITPMDSVIAEIRRRSTREVWDETTLESISTQRLVQQSGRGGVRINIPLPMPKQLESIFGPADKTHINITGREEITFAGETRKVDPFIGVEGRQKQSLFPSLDMKQNLDVRLDGTIGDKVNVQVDHSSDALSDQNNQIRLNYTGYEDDVIQLVELGSTSLSLPGSQLVSFSTQSKGLFGVKVLAQLGGTEMTFIASKQQGQSSSASFSPTGGSIGQSESRRIADIDYVQDTYFFFSDPDRTPVPTQSKNPYPQLADIDIYREIHPLEKQQRPNTNFFAGRAYVDNTQDGSEIQAVVDNLRAGQPVSVDSVVTDFELLTLGQDYTFVVDADDPNIVTGIELSTPIPDDEQRALAVVYKNVAGHQFGGQVLSDGTLAMKLIKPKVEDPTGEFGSLWNYMMRNIYNLGLSNIDPSTFDLEIEDNLVPRLNPTTPDSVSIPYIQIFGLDNQDQAGNAGHDGRIDAGDGAIIDLQRGLLIFPDRTPFAPDTSLVRQWTDGTFNFQETRDKSFAAQYDTSAVIYDSKISAQQLENYHQYDIVVNAVSTSKTFQINALNIIEGSERITIDGRTLTRGVDYSIDYQTGQVDLKGPALENLTPASKIQIDYEYKPFGGGGSSSLAGMSTVTKLGDNARFGTTFLYESKNVAADKPRVGEEPTRSMVADVNGSYSRQVGFLTSLANKLPLVDTDAPSTVSLGGEIAVSIPNPNTKGKGYVDDFEGVEDSDRLTLSRRAWYPASPPVINTPAGTETFEAKNKWGFVWYNIEPVLGVRKRDLNPELDEKENSLVQSLDIELRTKPDSLVAGVDTTQWVGVMTGFGGGGLDLTQGQFIEVWVNDFEPNPADRHGRIRIDLGQIDEDFFRPDSNKWDDEDKNKDGWVAINEDTGLDGLYDEGEPGYDPNTNPDPNGDDLDLNRINGRFVKVNGTEKNQVYDSEDLDGNGQLDQTNAYYSFTINLADSAVVDIREQFPGYDGFNRRGHQNDAWRLYRIKLSDGVIVSPTGQRPRIDQIRHARIWFNDLANTVRLDGKVEDGASRIQIADLKIVGNRWEDDGIRNLKDEKLDNPTTQFAIGVISTKSDPGVYNPPVNPNVQNQVADKETSLFLRYDNLTDSTQVRILKRFSGNGLDFSQYKQLNLWVHTDHLDSDLQYYFRLGVNEKNYYEIAVPLRSAYVNGTGWARVLIDMEQLTNLKLSRASPADTVSGTATDAIDGNTYPIKLVGAPTLLGVRFLYAGIRSLGTTGQIHSGELWIDDIWLGEVRRDIDTAQRLSGSINIAGGVLNVNAGWTRTGPDFRSLRQKRGSGAESQSFNINGKTNLMSFIPLFGFSIPLSGQYNKTTLKPKFVPNSDIEITDPALADSLSTVSVNEGFSTSLAKKNSKNALLRYTVDKMTTNFSYNRSQRRAPASADTSTSMSGTLGYQINWAPNKDIPIPMPLFRNVKLRWWLNSLNVRTSATRRTTRSWRYVGGEYRPDPFRYNAGLVNTGTANYSPFRSLSSSFSATIQRDVAIPHQWLGFDVGREVRRNHSLKVTYRPPDILFIGAFAPDVNVTTAYTEDASPTVRRRGDPRGVRNVSSSRNASLKLRFDIGGYMGKLFRKLGWDVGGGEKVPGGAVRAPTGGTGGTGGAGGAGKGGRTTAPEDSTKGKGHAASPLVAVRKLGQILTNVRSINATISQRKGSNYSRIPERPDLKYQFGIGTDSGVRKYGQVYDQPERVTDQLTIALDSGVELSDNIDLAGRYNRTRANSDFHENHTRAVSTTFPDMQLSWKGLEKFGLFRPFMSFAQANVNYKKFRQESGQRGQTADHIDQTMTVAPGMLLTWKNDMSSNVGVSYQKTTNETRGQKSENTNLSVNLDFKKSFRGGRGFKLPIPFFRKEVKWRSTLDSVVSIAYSRTAGKRYTQGTDFYTAIPGTNTIRVSPSLSYNFSRSLNGRAFVDYTRTFNDATAQTTTTVRVGVTAVFTF